MPFKSDRQRRWYFANKGRSRWTKKQRKENILKIATAAFAPPNRYNQLMPKDGELAGRRESINKHSRPQELKPLNRSLATDSISQLSKPVLEGALKNAVIYGVAAAAPPLGAVLIPAYTAINYAELGYGLFKVCREINARRGVSMSSLSDVSGETGATLAQSSADAIASAAVTKASQTGLFRDMASKTGLQGQVISEMTRGSLSAALSTSGGELAKFAIMKAVGV